MKEENPCIARCLNGQRGKAENPKWNDLPFPTSSRLWPSDRITDLHYPSATGN
jgi:hypothetical protein